MLLKGKTREQVEKERLDRLAQEVRTKRNALLAETDKYMLEDYPISKEEKDRIKAYRQELRDLPKQKGFPINIQWPVLANSSTREEEEFKI